MRDDAMISAKLELVSTCLYPTESIDSIKAEQVSKYCDAYNAGQGQQETVFVIQFDGEYYIYEGHEQVLAALGCGIEKIEVLEIDRSQLKYWRNGEQFIESLRSIGMTALYDFEAIGGFAYKTYPVYYRDSISN